MENTTKKTRRRKLYPGTYEAEKAKRKAVRKEDEPDFIGGAPNYDKFTGWSPEKVLAWLNID